MLIFKGGNILKENKFFGIPFIAVIVLLFVFVSTQIPAAHQAVKNLPIALINEDTGEIGGTLLQNVQENSKAIQTSDEPMIKWVILESQKEMEKEMDDQNLYGAIVIPSDFSEKFSSLQTPSPTMAELQIFINQGKNVNVANVITQNLSAMVTQINQMMSNQLLTAMETNNVPLSVEQARILTAPISSTITMLHPTGSLGNAPLSLFQPLWIASIVSAVMLFFAGKNRTFETMVSQLKFKSIQVLVAILLGFLAGFSLTWYTTVILDFEFESFTTVALFLSITCMSFILLISAVLSWIGMGGVILFVLLMFFGLPLLQLAPEMLPVFYKDWIYPWLPMRFMFDGVREILFFDGGVWNGATIVLMWTAFVSLIVHLAKSFVPTKNITSEEVSENLN